VKLEDHMDDRASFEMAMFRARAKATKEGRNPTFRQMLDEAQKELEEEHRRLEQEVAAARADSSPSTSAT
jgi:hypothetical protein